MPVMNYKPIYTTKEVAEILQTSRTTVGEMLRRGIIPYLLINGARKIRGTDLERFIETYPVETPKEPTKEDKP